MDPPDWITTDWANEADAKVSHFDLELVFISIIPDPDLKSKLWIATACLKIYPSGELKHVLFLADSSIKIDDDGFIILELMAWDGLIE